MEKDAFQEFRLEVIDRLARIETKMDALEKKNNGHSNGNGKLTALLVDLTKMIVAAAIGVLAGARVAG